MDIKSVEYTKVWTKNMFEKVGNQYMLSRKWNLSHPPQFLLNIKLGNHGESLKIISLSQ